MCPYLGKQEHVSDMIIETKYNHLLKIVSNSFPGSTRPKFSDCKYQQHSMSLNRNKGNSGRRKTGRSEENIEAVALQLENNPHVSSRRNGLRLPFLLEHLSECFFLNIYPNHASGPKMASLSNKRST